MKTIKAAISLLLLSSLSALADDTASTGSTSSLPMITAMTSGTKPAVDGVNGKVQVYGGAGQGNSVSISGDNNGMATASTKVEAERLLKTYQFMRDEKLMITTHEIRESNN